MRLIRRLAFLCALLFLAGAGLALGSSLLTRPCAELAGSGERHGQALVLSAGASVADGLDGQSRRRVLEGVRLWKAGTVWRLVMTGDAVGGRASAARMMADLAASRGVPREDITVEPDSQSTLQNALFSRPILADGGGVVLVSSGYHLWRGRASLAWAGVPVAATCRATRFGDMPRHWQVVNLGLESVKWWGNAGRAAIWSAAGALGYGLPETFLE